jgi:hypothetical protein
MEGLESAASGWIQGLMTGSCEHINGCFFSIKCGKDSAPWTYLTFKNRASYI